MSVVFCTKNCASVINVTRGGNGSLDAVNVHNLLIFSLSLRKIAIRHDLWFQGVKLMSCRSVSMCPSALAAGVR